MSYACIDVGSNTTRLLVADAPDGRLREILTQRVFTQIGQTLRAENGRLPGKKVKEVVGVIRSQVKVARQAGADQVCVIGTAAVRDARNPAKLVDAVKEGTGLGMRILDPREEAELAFVGATKTLGAPVAGAVAVVDVGGGSTEIAVGTVAGGATWAESFRVGSGFLADAYFASDPPSAAELHAVREHVAGVFEGLRVPHAAKAVAVGGSATSLRRVVGAELEYETLERSIRIMASTPVAEVAARFELAPERARLLPAGVLIFEELSSVLGQALTIGKGGLREGVILDLLAR